MGFPIPGSGKRQQGLQVASGGDHDQIPLVPNQHARSDPLCRKRFAREINGHQLLRLDNAHDPNPSPGRHGFISGAQDRGTVGRAGSLLKLVNAHLPLMEGRKCRPRLRWQMEQPRAGADCRCGDRSHMQRKSLIPHPRSGPHGDLPQGSRFRTQIEEPHHSPGAKAKQHHDDHQDHASRMNSWAGLLLGDDLLWPAAW